MHYDKCVSNFGAKVCVHGACEEKQKKKAESLHCMCSNPNKLQQIPCAQRLFLLAFLSKIVYAQRENKNKPKRPPKIQGHPFLVPNDTCIGIVDQKVCAHGVYEYKTDQRGQI